MPVTWEEATHDVLDTAQRLIGAHHVDLIDVRIVFMFRSSPALAGGKIAYAKTQKVSPQMRPLLDDADFIIWFSYRDWMGKNQAWRDATMDHQLCHCQVDDDGDEVKYSIRPHDIEEFNEVIRRHGSYTIDITGADAAIEDAKANQLYFSFSKASEALDQITKKPSRGKTYTVEVKSFAQAVEE